MVQAGSSFMAVETWEAIVAFIAPVLVSAVVRVGWPLWLKVSTALLVSFVAGTVGAVIAGGFSWADWSTSLWTIFLGSQLFYHTFWKPTSIGVWLEQKIPGLPVVPRQRESSDAPAEPKR